MIGVLLIFHIQSVHKAIGYWLKIAQLSPFGRRPKQYTKDTCLTDTQNYFKSFRIAGYICVDLWAVLMFIKHYIKREYHTLTADL